MSATASTHNKHGWTPRTRAMRNPWRKILIERSCSIYDCFLSSSCTRTVAQLRIEKIDVVV